MSSSERPWQASEQQSPELAEASERDLLVHRPAVWRARQLEHVPAELERRVRDSLATFGPLRFEEPPGRPRGMLVTSAFELQDGAAYLGHWLAGERCDRGICLFPDGRLFEGEWKKDMPHGFGRTVYPNGDLHEGAYEFGFPSGPGRYLTPAGVEFKGLLFKGHPNGRGAEVHQSGFKYEGDYAMGQKQGQGTVYFPDGTEYRGDLARGAIAGFGQMTWPDGRHYTGHWLEGQKHGRGVFYWKGIRFEGDYVRGSRQGSGTFRFTDGRELQATFVEDQIVLAAHQDGLCAFKDPDQTEPYLFSFVVREGKVVPESVARFSLSTLPDGSTLQNEKVAWPAMNLHYRNKLLDMLHQQLETLPAEDAPVPVQPASLSAHDEYRRAD